MYNSSFDDYYNTTYLGVFEYNIAFKSREEYRSQKFFMYKKYYFCPNFSFKDYVKFYYICG